MRILITGAAGSGTSTLAAALAGQCQARLLEADDYYWLPSWPPYQQRRPASERLDLLLAQLRAAEEVVVAGSVMGWGPMLEDGFDLVVFLYASTSLRIARLQQREIARFGRANSDFLAWAAQYDEGAQEGRSLARHRQWLAERTCPVFELSGELPTQAQLAHIQAVLV